MSKWEIRKEGIDNYFLEYKDKILPFHSNVGIVNELQGAIKNARLRMIKELKDKGMSLSYLTTKKEENGKVIYDNTDRQYIEEVYINEEYQKALEKIIQDTFNMNYLDLLNDVGIETEEESKEFFTELGQCLVGRTPRRREQ